VVQPVQLPDAKSHLKVTDTSEDNLIQMYIDAAQQHIEDYTGVVLEPRTIVEQFDGWRGARALRLRSWPINSVTVVTYWDSDGIDQTLDPLLYALASGTRPARLTAIDGAYWPPTRRSGAAVSVTVDAGYASTFDVPASLKQAILFLVGHFYANRESVAVDIRGIPAELPFTVQALCRRYRLKRV
jgi:uncharacterized phiE125 gp8 family phage protein